MNSAMTQQQVAEAIAEEQSESISQSYVSQIENGLRPHLSNNTRMVLARFFKVHPGYLVDDPDGYSTELMSEVQTQEDKFDLWLTSGADTFRRDEEVSAALVKLVRHPDSRKCIVLLGEIAETPDLVERLMQVLKPDGTHPRPTGLREEFQA